MILEQNDNKPVIKPSAVLILDPNGRLKLARWRLQSDGLHVYYIKELSLLEQFLQQKDIKIVIFNVDREQDLRILERIRETGAGVKIVTVLGDKVSGLRKQLLLSGVDTVLIRPLDFPRLSDAVKREFSKETPQKKGRLGGLIGVPLSVVNVCFSYRDVLDRMKTGIMVLEPEGKIKYINQPLMDLLGLKEEEVSGRHYRDVWSNLRGLQCNSVLQILDETFAEHGVSHSTELTVDNAEGPKSCRVEAHPVFSHIGEFAGAFLIIEDLANPNKIQRAAAQSEKLAMMGQLAAGAVHEIRNPLTSVRGFIQLLKDELVGTPKMDYIDIIIKEIDRVNNIVTEFLKLAKPAPPNRKPIDIRDLYEDIRLLTESEAILKNISFRQEFDGSLPPVMVDEEQIKKVIINIVRNSFEAMGDGGTFTARAYKTDSGQFVCLELSDTGPGMDENTLKHIFEPFYTTKEYGTGLGLAVSSEIMKSHGGRIEAKSELGRGTTIYLYFPY